MSYNKAAWLGMGGGSLVCALLLVLANCGGGGSMSGGSGGGSSSGAASSGSSSGGAGGSSSSGVSNVSVLTYHNDVARTGQNLNETVLTHTRVTSASFGKVGAMAVDGRVDAEPLYVPHLSVAGGTHNVVLVATEHASVYAFDADSFAQLWKVSLLGSGESTSDDHGCNQITPEIGITSTPVIDPAAGAHGTAYVVAMSKDGSGNYHQRLHVLDLGSGAELLGGPVEIQATFPKQGGTVSFAPGQYAERAGLLLLNGVLYLSWTSHCDIGTYYGWVMGYSPSSLQQTTVINLTPNGSEGSIWMSGAGLAADAGGNIYFLDANGTFDTTLDGNGFPSSGDFGNAFMKLSTAGGLKAADYFTMSNTVAESDSDEDLGSGGALLLPDLADGSGNTRHLAVGAGKDGNIYVVNRDSMGKFNPAGDSAIYQEIDGALGGQEFGMPAFFNNTVYYGAVGATLKAFPVANALLATQAASHSATSFGYPGTTPAISANGSADAIVWAVENGGTAVLHAYDAADLSHELYNSSQAGSRDQFAGNKFITPMIANGRVYVGTPNSVAVFGLLP